MGIAVAKLHVMWEMRAVALVPTLHYSLDEAVPVLAVKECLEGLVGPGQAVVVFAMAVAADEPVLEEQRALAPPTWILV